MLTVKVFCVTSTFESSNISFNLCLDLKTHEITITRRHEVFHIFSFSTSTPPGRGLGCHSDTLAQSSSRHGVISDGGENESCMTVDMSPLRSKRPQLHLAITSRRMAVGAIDTPRRLVRNFTTRDGNTYVRITEQNTA